MEETNSNHEELTTSSPPFSPSEDLLRPPHVAYICFPTRSCEAVRLCLNVIINDDLWGLSFFATPVV